MQLWVNLNVSLSALEGSQDLFLRHWQRSQNGKRMVEWLAEGEMRAVSWWLEPSPHRDP